MRSVVFRVILVILMFSININAAIGPEKSSLSLNSPDSKITAQFYLDNSNNLNYAVYFNNKLIMGPSPLSVNINNKLIGEKAEILNTSIKGVDEIYNIAFSKSSKVRNTHREGILNLRSGDILYNVNFRVYNDGVAFRYSYPKQAALESIIITEEKSSFKFLEDYKVYAMNLNTSTTPTGYIAYSYEDHYNKMNLSSINEDM